MYSLRVFRIAIQRSLLLSTIAVLSACGGGGGGGTATSGSSVSSAPSAPPISKVEAFRFLNQTTFGATEAEAARLIALGDSNTAYTRWLDAQIGLEHAALVDQACVTDQHGQNSFCRAL